MKNDQSAKKQQSKSSDTQNTQELSKKARRVQYYSREVFNMKLTVEEAIRSMSDFKAGMGNWQKPTVYNELMRPK